MPPIFPGGWRYFKETRRHGVRDPVRPGRALGFAQEVFHILTDGNYILDLADDDLLHPPGHMREREQWQRRNMMHAMHDSVKRDDMRVRRSHCRKRTFRLRALSVN